MPEQTKDHSDSGKGGRDSAAGTAACRIAPITVEFGDSGNRTISINTLQLRVRGRFSTVNIHKGENGGRDIGPMNAMPDIPGLRLTVDVNKSQCHLYDPLSKMPELLDRIQKVEQKCNIAKQDKRTAVPAVTQKLDPDKLKTLLLELHRKCTEDPKCAAVVEGELPSLDQIHSLKGRQLNDPWNQGRKPKYKDQVEDWEREVDRALA